MLQLPPDSHWATASQSCARAPAPERPAAAAGGGVGGGATGGCATARLGDGAAGRRSARLCRATSVVRAWSSWACMAACAACRSATCCAAAACIGLRRRQRGLGRLLRAGRPPPRRAWAAACVVGGVLPGHRDDGRGRRTGGRPRRRGARPARASAPGCPTVSRPARTRRRRAGHVAVAGEPGDGVPRVGEVGLRLLRRGVGRLRRRPAPVVGLRGSVRRPSSWACDRAGAGVLDRGLRRAQVGQHRADLRRESSAAAWAAETSPSEGGARRGRRRRRRCREADGRGHADSPPAHDPSPPLPKHRYTLPSTPAGALLEPGARGRAPEGDDARVCTVVVRWSAGRPAQLLALRDELTSPGVRRSRPLVGREPGRGGRAGPRRRRHVVRDPDPDGHDGAGAQPPGEAAGRPRRPQPRGAAAARRHPRRRLGGARRPDRHGLVRARPGDPGRAPHLAVRRRAPDVGRRCRRAPTW